MAIVANLDVVLRALTGKFDQGLDRSKRKAKAFSSQIKKIGATLAAGFTARAIIDEINILRSEIDRLGKTAAKLGVATENLAGLRFAARLAGIEANTLDMALQRFTRRVSEAAVGTGEAQGALKELGLDAAQLNRMSPDQALRRVAEAFSQIQTQSDKVRLAFKLFDSEGVALVNLLEGGSRAFDEATEKAKAFGTALSEIEVKQIERMNDRITETGEAVKGIKTTLLKEFTKSVDGLIVGWELVSKGVDQARRTAARFNRERKFGEDTLIARPTDANTQRFERMRRRAVAIDKANARFAAMEEQRMKEQAKARAAEQKLINQRMEIARREAMARQQQIMARGRSATAEFASPIERAMSRLNDLAFLLRAGAINLKTFNRGVIQIDKDFRDATEQPGGGRRPEIAALAAGSQEAFAAFSRNQKNELEAQKVAKQQLMEQQRGNLVLSRVHGLLKRGLLGKANL